MKRLEKLRNKDLHDIYFFFKFQENDLMTEREMDRSWCMHAGEEKYIRSLT